MSVEETVRRFVLENFLFSDDRNLLDDRESLLEKGIIDSTGVLELIEFLEQEFGIRVDDDEMIPENLDSLHSIAAFVGRKRAAR